MIRGKITRKEDINEGMRKGARQRVRETETKEIERSCRSDMRRRRKKRPQSENIIRK